MNQRELPTLPQYSAMERVLELERKTFVKINGLDNDDNNDEFARPVEKATVILNALEKIQKHLWNFFSLNPSLISLFDIEFISFRQFLRRDCILDICFFDDYLISEKELFVIEDSLEKSLENSLKKHFLSFTKWTESKEKLHKKTQEFLKSKFDTDTKVKDLECQCVNCIGDYRANLRELVILNGLQLIDTFEKDILNNMEKGVEKVGELYRRMHRELEKTIHRVRYRLRKTSLKKLEYQIKAEIKERFSYSSELTQMYIRTITPFFNKILDGKKLKRDFITEDEYKKFFKQLSHDIWKGNRYLEKEFNKFTNALLLLKRKDISSKILKEYLGEFWAHSKVREIKRKITYHMGPTNSGKTFHAIEALCKAKNGCYLAPLRLLAAELFDKMNSKGVCTSLLTGEEVIEIPGATHYSSTIEMAKLQHVFDCCVIDEIQMISDPQRGWAWTRALVNMNVGELHICGDSSALDLIQEITKLCGDELEIKKYERMTMLEVEKETTGISELQKSDAVIVFSRRSALKFKQNLERLNFKVSIVYGRLSPEVRREQARKFDQNETDIMVSTDAIAMGMNLPIKRIVFSTLSKFIDSREYEITQSEIKQIAGRAGRYKRFPTGYITCLSKVENGIEMIQSALKATLKQKTQSMVGPDLETFSQVNSALKQHSLPELSLTEFLRLFNTMNFHRPFYCVSLKEMIEVAEMVEEADGKKALTDEEIFGFSCAPVNLGLIEHVQYFVEILSQYVIESPIKNDPIDYNSNDIDYLETSIKCVELYQWLARHFYRKNFEFNESELLANKSQAIEKLNILLSDKIIATCESCGVKLLPDFKFSICENCFKRRRFYRKKNRGNRKVNKKKIYRRGKAHRMKP